MTEEYLAEAKVCARANGRPIYVWGDPPISGIRLRDVPPGPYDVVHPSGIVIPMAG